MAVVDVELLEESQQRYLIYALSVVSSRALPDVRDGLKPVQRRILYAMLNNLGLGPDKHHRKSAAVVGEVLARYHPHGDSACYEAMVRMAQDFNFRYPLVDGQGNFGSLDGDSAAAYRYTEARLTKLAIEIIGDIWQDTVAERDNFDQTVKEPVVLPARVPNLLINGASGIAVGMATAIPPHNLNEVIKALLVLLEDPSASDAKVCSPIKGPDFPTGCSILNSRSELKDIYETGRGAIRMRGDYKIEAGQRGKRLIVVNSIPYSVDKSNLVERIADLIIQRKVPQLTDVRDESTDEIRVVLELGPEADADKAMAYLFKHTPLQQNFNVNLTALIPTDNPHVGRPALCSLRQMLQYFVDFRIDVSKLKLSFEKRKLEERVHLLEGLIVILDALDEVIAIVRKSDGRADSAQRLMRRFELTEIQALFIVDLRIYQLSKTSIVEVTSELDEKTKRIKDINRLLKSEPALREHVAADLKRIAEEFGDSRRSTIVNDYAEPEFNAEEYVQHENVHVIVTRDGWLKRIRENNDPATTRIREGDALFFVRACSTRDSIGLISNFGNLFMTKVFDLSATSGFGEPVQKMFKFSDGEQIAACVIVSRPEGATDAQTSGEILVFSQGGLGARLGADILTDTKKIGKRIMRLGESDRLAGVIELDRPMVFFLTAGGYGLLFMTSEVPLLTGPGKGVILQKLGRDDQLVAGLAVAKGAKVIAVSERGTEKEISISARTIGSRAHKGNKVVERIGMIVGLKHPPGQQSLF